MSARGKCVPCNRKYTWPKSRLTIGDCRCPKCGTRLQATSSNSNIPQTDLTSAPTHKGDW